jgi:hypothetical protein
MITSDGLKHLGFVAERLASTKTKLEALGLTVDEIKDAFGIE